MKTYTDLGRLIGTYENGYSKNVIDRRAIQRQNGNSVGIQNLYGF